jgi:predicted nucleotidyltransferase
MATSINGYLSNLASTYYISSGSNEDQRIATSYARIAANLKSHFGNKLLSVSEFGSYKRDTILPRLYDADSDVDIMVKFDHNSLGVTAETYRTWLLAFAEKYYSSSSVSKNFPTVIVELQHIMFDLVPTRQDSLWPYTLYIPDRGNNWQPTNPAAFDQTVVDANRAHGYIVKPIIRLLKAWNAKALKPYSSYELEAAIASMNFTGDDYQKGFFWAIDRLNSIGKPNWAIDKIQALKNNKTTITYWLEQNNLDMAKSTLHRILPLV